MTDSIKKIGIDLDNTIIFYDEVFQMVAKKFGLIGNNNCLSKESLRNQIRNQKNGEKKWQKLQGYVYGEGINKAALFPGVYRFLWRCKERKIDVEIVSHKTDFGHFDDNKISLRDSATNFLINQAVEITGRPL